MPAIRITVTPFNLEDILITMLLRKFFLVLILLHTTNVFAIEKEMQEQFARGLTLIHDKNYVQAIAIFSKLTKEYPTFPEPYNNLAYIYTVQGNYIKAQDILQSAFKNNPSYALVYENLNAIYAEIARGIYEKGLGAKDSSRVPLKNLYIIDHLFDKVEKKVTTVVKAVDKDNTGRIENTKENVASPTFISTTPSTYAPLSKK